MVLIEGRKQYENNAETQLFIRYVVVDPCLGIRGAVIQTLR